MWGLRPIRTTRTPCAAASPVEPRHPSRVLSPADREVGDRPHRLDEGSRRPGHFRSANLVGPPSGQIQHRMAAPHTRKGNIGSSGTLTFLAAAETVKEACPSCRPSVLVFSWTPASSRVVFESHGGWSAYISAVLATYTPIRATIQTDTTPDTYYDTVYELITDAVNQAGVHEPRLMTAREARDQ
jgi:hypothetical protein